MGRALVVLGTSALGVVAGMVSLAVARDEPAHSFAGSSTAGGAALLAAGWALIGCGVISWARRPESRFGPLLATAGFAWFLLEWNNPGVSSSAAFAAGLVLYVTCPPLVGHAVLAYPDGRLGSRPAVAVLAVAYAGGLLVLGLLPALFFDADAQGCGQCPTNLVAVADDRDAVADLYRSGLYLGVGWASALALLVLRKLVRGSGRTAGPVFLFATAYLTLVAAWFVASLDRGYLANGTFERRLWLAQAGALVGVAAGVAWAWLRTRRARSAVARLVIDLAESPPPGGLRDALAAIVGDPDLVLAYPVDSGRLVNARGQAVELPEGLGRTSLVRDGRVVAVVGHEPGLLGDRQLVDEVAAAARLALENERLQAELQARLEELRASRTRIVEAGDAERKRLERDLHDGAQQRLVGLALSLRLARSHATTARVDAAALARLDEAEAELRLAVAELRELAHGIFPAVLADEGLAAAIEALAEEGRVPIRVGALPQSRFPAAIETAAYTIVAEVVRTARAGIAVRAARSGDALMVEVETTDVDALALVQLEDRVGAIEGRLLVDRRNGGATIRAELPCAS